MTYRPSSAAGFWRPSTASRRCEAERWRRQKNPRLNRRRPRAGFNEDSARLRGTPRPRAASRAAAKGSRVGDDLVEAFEEMAAHLRGEIELAAHDVPAATMT